MMRVGLAFCDAGAANQLFAYVSDLKYTDFIGYFDGPAKHIYKQFLPRIAMANNLEELVAGSDVLISGTGWSSDTEHECRVLASLARKKSIAILDHWVNYQERFRRHGVQQHPDEIWVFDEIALQRAMTQFLNIKIKLKRPAYKDKILKEISVMPTQSNRLLYICEPLRVLYKGHTPLEEIYLSRFLSKVQKCENLRFKNIYLQLHPSETRTKYNQIIRAFSQLNIKISDCDLVTALGKSETVIGCSSYALYLAFHAGKEVISASADLAKYGLFDIKDIVPMSQL